MFESINGNHKQYEAIFFAVVLLFTGILVHAQVQLPNFFGDHMVLQQQAVAIWGKDKPGAKISVTGSWGKKANTVADADGKWKVKIQTPAAGGPYNLKVKGSNEVQLKDIMIGEVWLCSGQSNKEMPMRGYTNQPVLGSNDAILHSANTSIRFFNAKKITSITPLTNAEGQWKLSDPSTTGDYSATAYFLPENCRQFWACPSD